MNANTTTQPEATEGLLRPALVLFLLLTLIIGLAYPLLVTWIAQAAFPEQANGSLIRQGDHVVGSSLIGQPFTDPGHFWGRPSATSPAYNGAGSGGANFGPTNPALIEAVKGRILTLHEADPGNTAPIPADLVTTSASGLDPHISRAAAEYQAGRVARHSGVKEAEVRALIEAHSEGRWAGFLGEPRVNVLQLNLALDEKQR